QSRFRATLLRPLARHARDRTRYAEERLAAVPLDACSACVRAGARTTAARVQMLCRRSSYRLVASSLMLVPLTPWPHDEPLLQLLDGPVKPGHGVIEKRKNKNGRSRSRFQS